MPQNNLQLNERDDIQQILGNPPRWILRWGITLVALSVGVLILLSWLIKYPDIIQAPIVLMTDNPPIRVITKTSGTIKTLNVEDQQTVKKETILAILDNTATVEDVFLIEELLTKIDQTTDYKGFYRIRLPHRPNLGTLQNNYSAFAQNFNTFKYLRRQPTVEKKIAALYAQIENTKKLSLAQQSQIETITEEVALSQSKLNRNQKLLQEKIISKEQFEQIKTNHLQYERQLKNAKTTLINHQISIDQLQIAIIELRQGKKDESLTGFVNIKENARKLYSEIQLWKETFLLVAPINGKIAMNQIWSENQFLQAGSEFLVIVPEAISDALVGKAMLPITGAGKVDTTTIANIRFAGYPYQEYGVVKAKIKNISLIPVKVGEIMAYPIDIDFPNHLMTTYHKTIPFNQEMQGTAHIITEDRRILQRILDKLNNILKNR